MGSETRAPVPPYAGRQHDGEFKSFGHWVAKAKSWLAGMDAACFDAKGRPCRAGLDFMRARDEGAFPVRYWFPRESAHWASEHGEDVLVTEPPASTPPATPGDAAPTDADRRALGLDNWRFARDPSLEVARKRLRWGVVAPGDAPHSFVDYDMDDLCRTCRRGLGDPTHAARTGAGPTGTPT